VGRFRLRLFKVFFSLSITNVTGTFVSCQLHCNKRFHNRYCALQKLVFLVRKFSLHGIIMFAKILTAALFAVSLLTLPINGTPVRKPHANPSTLNNLVIPSSTLPPPTGLVLKFVGLGIGTQNYTCATPSSTAVPASDGALGMFLRTQLVLNSAD
jgi:hypothetical protein